MASKAHIQFIIFTAIVTICLILGIYMLLMSRQKLEKVMGKVFGIRDMEITTGMVVFTKVLGFIFVVIGGLLGWKFLF